MCQGRILFSLSGYYIINIMAGKDYVNPFDFMMLLSDQEERSCRLYRKNEG